MGQYGMLKLTCWFTALNGELEMRSSSVRIDPNSYNKAYREINFTDPVHNPKHDYGYEFAVRDWSVYPYNTWGRRLPHFHRVKSTLEFKELSADEQAIAHESANDNQGIEMV